MREKKINALNSVKDYLEGIVKGARVKELGADYLHSIVSLEVLEKHLWSIIDSYSGYWQENTALYDLLMKDRRGFRDFAENWQVRLVNATNVKEINNILGIVNKALLKFSGRITQGLKYTYEQTEECWIRTDKSDRKTPESSQNLREKLAKFEAKYYGNFVDTEWEKSLAQNILRDVLLEQIEKSEKWEESQGLVQSNDTKNHGNNKWRGNEIEESKQLHKNAFDNIMEILRVVEFWQDEKGDWKATTKLKEVEHEANIDMFRKKMKLIIEENDQLKDEWLESGLKKADLLRKVDALIEERTGVNVNDEPRPSENDNNSSQTSVSSQPTKNEWNKWVEETKDSAINKINNALQTAGISTNDLKSENQTWLEKIKTAAEKGRMTDIQDIEAQLLSSIDEVKNSKSKGAELESLKEKFQNQNEQLVPEEFTKALKDIAENIGDKENEAKIQETEKAMKENDPETYFQTFIQWAKGEMETYGMKENDLKEEEKKLLSANGITDLNNFEQVEKELKEKIVTKKYDWTFSQELDKWVSLSINHLKEQATKIKQQIYGLKNSANPLKQEAFKRNENKANEILAKLDSQKNQTVTPNEKGFWKKPEVVIPTVLLAVGLVVVIGIVIGKRKPVKVKK